MDILLWVVSFVVIILFAFMIWTVMTGKVINFRKQNIKEMHLDKAKEELRKKRKPTRK